MSLYADEEIMINQKLTLVVDIDGTLLKYKTYIPNVFGEPIPGAVEFLKAQYEDGHKIILHTARSIEEENALRQHLDACGIIPWIHGLELGKPIGHVYIDDRALRFFGDWKHTTSMLDIIKALRHESIINFPKARVIIDTKTKMYDLYNRGLFGNRIRSWASVDDFIADPNKPGTVALRYKGINVAGPCISYVTIEDLAEFVDYLVNSGWERDRITVCENPPNKFRTLQGQLRRSDAHYDLTYSFIKAPMREAFEIDQRYAQGLTALALLKHYLDPSSYDDIMEMLDTYDGGVVEHKKRDFCVIEFTAFSKDIGVVPSRNTIFWEVRNY
jgi:hypothetical protein